MKRQLLGVVGALLVIMLVGAVNAVAQTISLEAKIPFDFVIGGKTLPAGDYSIYSTGLNAPQLILFRNARAGASAIASTGPVEPKTGRGTNKLVFHRYGDKYFLSLIWGSDDRVARGLGKSKLEREFTASTASSSEVIVAANSR